MQIRLILFLILLFQIGLQNRVSAIGNEHSGARSLGLANANVTLHDIWSTNNNQAGLAYLKSFEVGFSYENRFGLSELSLKNLNAATPIKFGAIGLTVQQFGFTDYNENKFGLAYGLKISEKVSLGAQIDYLFVSISETQTSNKSGFTAEVGLLAKLTDKLTMGFHVFNLPNTSLSGDIEQKIPMIFSAGLNYEFSKKVFAVVDIEKAIDLDPNVKIGIEYHPIEPLYFRGGINTFDFKFAFGMGVKVRSFNIDFAISHQTYIGYVSQIALRYTLSKK